MHRSACRVFICGLTIAVVSTFDECRVNADEWLPEDLAAAAKSADKELFPSTIERRFQENLGREFPNLALETADGRSTSLRQVLNGPTVVFYAGGPCPYTFSEIEGLETSGWTHPEGRVITIVKFRKLLRKTDLGKALRGKNDIFAVKEWAKVGLERYIRIYPIYFYLNENGELTSFQIVTRSRFPQREEAKEGGSR